MNSPRDLLNGLLEYIQEQAKEIDPKGYRLSNQKGFVKRNTELTDISGLEFDLRLAGDHIWLRLERIEVIPPPAIYEKYKTLFVVSNDPHGVPPKLDEIRLNTLLADYERKTKSSPKNNSAQSPTIDALRQKANAALQEYIVAWKQWAQQERPRRKSIALYGDLFALKHQIEAAETNKPQELVWGVGVATWQIPFNETSVGFEYPLLTQVVEISIDEKSMALEIRPRSVETRAEMEAFIACAVNGATEVEQAIKEQLQRQKDRPVSPFDASSYTDVLKLVASNLDSNGGYKEIISKGDAIPSPENNLVVTDAWVVLSRPRVNNYLSDDLRRLRQKLTSGCEIPVGPLAFVTPPSDKPVEFEAVRFRGISSRGSSRGKSDELYFPLPYNDEQVIIIQRLERAAGVTVQGPPGTGKTHTIANVICHYLATGRRVLVTSRGETALEVLQAKIPEEVRALSVALIANDREGVRQFQASIEAIQHQVSQLNPEQTRQDIARLESAIERAHHGLASIDRRIDEIAVTQLSEIEVDGSLLRAQKLAELAVSGKEQYGWFDDEISLSPENAPPLNEDESAQLRESRRKVCADIVYVDAKNPSVDSLPSARAIAELHQTISSMRAIEAEVARGDVLALKATTGEVFSSAKNLLAQIEEAKAIVEELENTGEAWPLDLRLKCRLSSFISERQALESLFVDVDELIKARAYFLKRPVDFPESGLRAIKTKEAIARAAQTSKPFGLIAIGMAEAKEHVAAIKVSGLPPNTKEDWAHVNSYVELDAKVLSFVARWNKVANELSIPKLEGGIIELRRIELVAITARKAHRLATQFDALLPNQANEVFSEAHTKIALGSSVELNHVKSSLLRHLTKAELAEAAIRLETLQERLVGKTGPVTESLKSFISGQLGNPEIPVERSSAKFVELVAELRRIAALSVDLALIRDFANRIDEAGAPKFASRVRTVAVAASGEETVFPVTWRSAWNWARVRTHLERIDARSELLTLSTKRCDLESGLARLYNDMVAKAAWLATKRNATPKVMQALAGYATAIRRIGQGTGPNATRYRRDAREAMLDAVNAVPCWIMNHARISESMPPEIGAFDLVIVDEASQSDLWALPAILRGKKILVVGDDKQVSPDGGFIASERIQELKTRFLSEQPFGTEMTPEKSLYDLAARVFAAEQVMLREHFRCVPPIIAYSNRVFYKGGIQPLRIPRSSERVDPPLVDIYVPDGIRSRHDTNEDEAQAIADEITAILSNEAFAGRSIGVVSLLGIEQAKRIDEVVRKNCNAAELHHRKFECGDARTFQGSERDFMFLSMVADNKNCKALSGNMFDQRFNVASTRARDRMYLVRSVQIGDLSEKDLRLTLLNHFNKPLVVDKEEAEALIDRCESGFEKEVFTRLISSGYRVIPQVKTGAYRIDMVVEGAGDNRLAIELDGDDYHGPDRWQHDMNRQRILERAGWIFWRCFASTWALRKDEIYDELRERLAKMGIEPIGALEKAPGLVEKRIWKKPLATDETELSAAEE